MLGQQSHRNHIRRLTQDLLECRIITGLREQRVAAHGTIENVEDETAHRKPGASRHGQSLANSPSTVNRKDSRPLFVLPQQKKWTDAEAVLRHCLVVREKKQPDAWTTFNVKSLLGGAILGRARSAGKAGDAESLARAAGWYREAEPLLLAGYAGMKAREKTIPPQGKSRLTEALDWLTQLYTATNKPNEAKKWQAERAKYPETKAAGKKK